jgi:hypothetical protein
MFQEILQKYGPSVALIAYFVWRDFMRDKATTKRADLNDKYIREELRTSLSLAVEALRASTHTSNSIVKALEKRPCIAREMSTLSEVQKAT